MARSFLIALLACACCPLAAFAQEGPAGYAEPEAFDAGKQEALRAVGAPFPRIDPQIGAIPEAAPSMLPHEHAGDLPGATDAGIARKNRCAQDPASAECAASATFSASPPALQAYPLGRDDAVFGGAARGQVPVGLGLGGDPPQSCVTLTLAADESAREEFACISGDFAPRPEELVLISAPPGDGLGASFGRGAGGVHSLEVSSGGWISGLLYGAHDYALTVSLSGLPAIAQARLERIWYDDWAAVFVNGTAVFVGPGGGDRLELRGWNICTGASRCSATWDFGPANDQWHDLGIDITPLLKAGENVIAVRLIHGGQGRLDLQGKIVESAVARDGVNWREYLERNPEAKPCGELAGRGCFQHATGRCLLESVAGGCARWEYRYKCPGSKPRTEVVCDREDEMHCADGSCFDKADEPTSAGEFARSAGMLELARQAGVYLDPESLRIFSGYPAHCRERAFGLADCCEPDPGGDLSNATVFAALAGGAAGGGIRFAGSPHTYDALYVAEAPGMLSGLLPDADLGYAPGLSFYGIRASYSAASGLVVSFDPASFAVAVALAVAQSLLQCSRGEQVLALRNGKGLCTRIGTYCSRETLLGCATEKTGHCCYNSKLARSVAAEGRTQVGRGWGTPERPECAGFTAEELESMDFASMDLSGAFSDIAPQHTAELIARFKDGAETFVSESAIGEAGP